WKPVCPSSDLRSITAGKSPATAPTQHAAENIAVISNIVMVRIVRSFAGGNDGSFIGAGAAGNIPQTFCPLGPCRAQQTARRGRCFYSDDGRLSTYPPHTAPHERLSARRRRLRLVSIATLGAYSIKMSRTGASKNRLPVRAS